MSMRFRLLTDYSFVVQDHVEAELDQKRAMLVLEDVTILRSEDMAAIARFPAASTKKPYMIVSPVLPVIVAGYTGWVSDHSHSVMMHMARSSLNLLTFRRHFIWYIFIYLL